MFRRESLPQEIMANVKKIPLIGNDQEIFTSAANIFQIITHLPRQQVVPFIKFFRTTDYFSKLNTKYITFHFHGTTELPEAKPLDPNEDLFALIEKVEVVKVIPKFDAMETICYALTVEEIRYLEDSIVRPALREANAKFKDPESRACLAGIYLTLAALDIDRRWECLRNPNRIDTFINLSWVSLNKTSEGGTGELIGAYYPGANLDQTNFNKSMLCLADFSEAYLLKSTFDAADLSNAIFDRSYATEVSFNKAQLKDASLVGATLNNSKFNNADLRGAKFDKADLSHCDFKGAKLNGASLQGAKLIGVNLNNLDLTDVAIDGMLLFDRTLNTIDVLKGLLKSTVAHQQVTQIKIAITHELISIAKQLPTTDGEKLLQQSLDEFVKHENSAIRNTAIRFTSIFTKSSGLISESQKILTEAFSNLKNPPQVSMTSSF